MRVPHPALHLHSLPQRVPALGVQAPVGLGDGYKSQESTPSYTQVVGGAISDFGAGMMRAAAEGAPLGQSAAIGGVATAGQIASGMTTAAWAVPVIGAAVAGVTFWLASMFRRNAQKKAATQVVEQIEPKLKENLQAYFSGPRTLASQQQALANFDAAWEAMVQACQNSRLGDAGKRCIGDRQQGACHYRAACQTRDPLTGVCIEYGPNGSGTECWNWFVGYRDPIANDPLPQRGGVPALNLQPVTEAFSGGSMGLLLGAGLIAAGLLMGGNKDEE